MKIIYISGGDVSVYDSQVLAYLDFLVEKGHDVYLIQGYTNDREYHNLSNKQKGHVGIHIIWYKSAPVYPFFERKKINGIYNALKTVPGYQDAIVHVRSEIEGTFFKKLAIKHNLKNAILVDIRGLVTEEFKYKIANRKDWRKFTFIYQQKYMQRCADYFFSPDKLNLAITAVSPVIVDYIKKRYPKFNHTLYVHQNIAGKQFVFHDQARIEVRKKYRIPDDALLAVCSTNGNGVWQKDHLVIQKLLELGIKVINLSKKDCGINGCISATVPFSDMPKVLSAADVAVLWREDTFMNNSASPSKFSEFAAMGLYVLHNSSVYVATEYINRTGAGCLFNNVDDITMPLELNTILFNRKQWCLEGHKTFGIENLGNSYIETYEELNNH